MESIKYKNYIITQDKEWPNAQGKFIFYPSDQKPDHDYDYNGESYQYCGNCGWSDTIAGAKMSIDDKIINEGV